MNTDEIIVKITSKNQDEILEAARAIIFISQDHSQILPLIDSFEQIKTKISHLHLGGLLARNQEVKKNNINIKQSLSN